MQYIKRNAKDLVRLEYLEAQVAAQGKILNNVLGTEENDEQTTDSETAEPAIAEAPAEPEP